MKLKKLTKGIHDRIPMDFYHGDCCPGPSVSSSGLRSIFVDSPADYFDTSYLNPDRPDEDAKEKEAFILGRAAHHLLLGEDDFSTQFIMRPETLLGEPWQGNRKVCRQWLVEQAEAGRTVLTPTQIESIKGISKGLAKHPLVHAGILNGKIEQSLIWQDKATGIWLKARPDAIPTDSGDVGDLKITSHKGYDLDNSASKLRYDMQAALVKWGLKEVLGIDMSSFSLVFARNKRPHSVDVLTFHNEDIDHGAKDLRVALDTFARCLETGDWFGPGGTQRDARYLAFSKYVRDRAEFRRDELKRELERSHMKDEPTQAEYLATP